MKNIDYLSEKIRWIESNDPEYPFQAVHLGNELLLRLNDFPAEPLYTLIVNGKEVMDFDDLPQNWVIKSTANVLAYNSVAD